MPDEPLSYYWDSCVWLSYLNGYRDRVPNIEPFLIAARQTASKQSSGKQGLSALRLVTSTLSIAEVAFVETEKVKRALSHDEEQRIDALLSVAQLVGAHIRIMQDARALIREAVSKGIRIPAGADAVHLATARRMDTAEFHTYDNRLLALDGHLGLVIRKPQPQQPSLPLGVQ